MIKIDKSYYKSVPASSSDTSDYTLGSEDIYLTHCCGNAIYHADVKVEIIWDPDTANEVIFSTHGDVGLNINKDKYSGSGRKIRIKLTNDSSQT